MGLSQKGLLGVTQGSVGPIVFCMLKGQQVSKSQPIKSNKPPTLKQLAQTLTFGISTSFLSHFSDIIRVGFKPAKRKSTGMNAAVSKLVTENIIGIYPDFKIDYPNVTLTDGKLEGALDLLVVPKAARTVELTWSVVADAVPGVVSTRNKDVVYATFYDPVSDRHTIMPEVVKRGAGKATIKIPRSLTGATVYGWFGFISEDGKESSLSDYLGAVVPLV